MAIVLCVLSRLAIIKGVFYILIVSLINHFNITGRISVEFADRRLFDAPGYSFPSGHASSSFAAATAILLHNRKAGAIAILYASLVAFTRLYAFVHYPSDVIAGAYRA